MDTFDDTLMRWMMKVPQVAKMMLEKVLASDCVPTVRNE